MCGILGFLGPQGSVQAHSFSAALDVLAHRGPDGRGIFSDADLLLGHRFVSRSDTEVLLHAYLAWGSDCLRRLNGMWAFAIWLPAQRKLFFARDRLSMAHGIETRLPFMDYRLVEWAFSQPSEIKIGRGVTKRVVREYLAATGQRAIADRLDKQGYPTPAEKWLGERDAEIPRTLLLSPGSAIREYCDQGRIAGLIRLFGSGRPGLGNHLYRLLSTELWLRECVTGQAPVAW